MELDFRRRDLTDLTLFTRVSYLHTMGTCMLRFSIFMILLWGR